MVRLVKVCLLMVVIACIAPQISYANVYEDAVVAIASGKGGDVPALLASRLEKKDAEAQYLYGHYLRWVAQSPARSLYFFEQAAKKDHARATLVLGGMLQRGDVGTVQPKEALRYFQLAAKEGDAEAQNILGEQYEHGGLVVPDIKRAVKLYEKAAEASLPDALFNLASQYNKGGVLKKNAGKAKKLYRKAALLGNLRAQNALKGIFGESIATLSIEDKPTGTGAYLSLARKYHKKALKGDVQAQRIMGGLYLHGLGVWQNFSFARYWYTRAAEQGDIPSNYELGRLHIFWRENVDYAKAEWFLRKAAENRYIPAQERLAWLLTLTKKDVKEAALWYERAAQKGDVVSQFQLGSAYQFGRGVKKDMRKAVSWYSKSAESGYHRAQYRLATLFILGEGVPKDAIEGMRWLALAAEQGDRDAQVDMAQLIETDENDPNRYQHAAEWYMRAASLGDGFAMSKLGSFFAAGVGVEKNYKKARMWLTLAAKQGVAEAQYNLGAMFANGDGVKKDSVQGYMWFLLSSRYAVTDFEKERGLAACAALSKEMSAADVAKATARAKAWKADKK